jgi:hypothetical protein
MTCLILLLAGLGAAGLAQPSTGATRQATAGDVAAPVPLQPGEHLSYRVSWAVVPGAGEIKIDARRELVGDVPRLWVTSTTATRRVARMLMPFEARGEAMFDLETGKLLWQHDTSLLRNRRTERVVNFDYDLREATYRVPGSPNEPRTLEMPPGDPTDIMMGLLQTRTWNIKPGESRDALILFDNDFYELTLHATHYEDVRVPVGSFRTIVLEPRMEKTPPKGMFRRGSTVRVWIAQDDRRLPVRFEVEFKIGTGTAVLDAYRPPAESATSAGGGKP